MKRESVKILGLIAKTYNDFDDILDDWVHEGWSEMQRENLTNIYLLGPFRLDETEN